MLRIFLKALPVFLILSLAESSAAVRFNVDGNILLAPILIGGFLFYLWSVRWQTAKALAIFVDVMALMSILANYAACFDASRHPELGVNSSSMDYAWFLLGTGSAAALVFAWFFLRFGSTLADRLNISKVWYMTLLFSGCILLINLLARPLKYETLQVNRIGTVMIGLLFVLLIIWVVMNTVFYFIVIEMMKAAEEEQELKILRLQEEQYRSQLDYIRQSARTRHDFRQTLRTLNNMARADRAEDICSFLSDYMNDLPENETVIYCKNSAVNAILNHYAVQAKQKGIAVRLDIDDVGEQGMLSDAELCTMLGNLLENAIEELNGGQTEAREIRLGVICAPDANIITCEDTGGGIREEILPRIFEKGVTSKGENHGTGLFLVKQLADKYGGEIEIETEEGEGTCFTVTFSGRKEEENVLSGDDR